MAEIRVDVSSPIPVYEQIRAQVAGLVTVGALRDGARLPSSRALARDLGVAVGTVQRAYRELEASGVVASRRRTGTIVTTAATSSPVPGPGAPMPLPEISGDLVAAVRALVTQARASGLRDGELLALVRGALSQDQDDNRPRAPHPTRVQVSDPRSNAHR